MAVTHFIKDGQILCGTKGKSPLTTTEFSETTCKRCLKKKVSTTQGIKAELSKKFGYHLCFPNGTIMKLGEEPNEKIGVIVVMSKLGNTSTSMKIKNTRGILSKSDEKYFRNYFDNKKTVLGHNPQVNEVFADFVW